MRRSERRNNLQICPRRYSNTGGSDLWSSKLPLDHGGALRRCCRNSTAHSQHDNEHMETWRYGLFVHRYNRPSCDRPRNCRPLEPKSTTKYQSLPATSWTQFQSVCVNCIDGWMAIFRSMSFACLSVRSQRTSKWNMRSALGHENLMLGDETKLSHSKG